jgi:hypothetical protein
MFYYIYTHRRLSTLALFFRRKKPTTLSIKQSRNYTWAQLTSLFLCRVVCCCLQSQKRVSGAHGASTNLIRSIYNLQPLFAVVNAKISRPFGLS